MIKVVSSKLQSRNDRIFSIFNATVMIVIVIVILYPLYFILVASITDPTIVNQGGLLLYPKKLFLKGYIKIFEYSPIWQGYLNTIIYTVIGTFVNIVVTIPCAYALSRKDLPGKNILMIIFSFTMFFSGGLIPTYLVVTKLHLIDSMWSMILPCAVSVWNVIIARTYFQNTIPDELLEAAKIDGCSDFMFFIRIVLPLCKVIIAVMVLFYGVGHWNTFFDALIYLNDDMKQPLQIILRNLLIMNTVSNSMVTDPMSLASKAQLADQLKYGIIIASTLPLIIIYPFLQKYFTKGVMIGSIKG